jgi:hypothetical protein
MTLERHLEVFLGERSGGHESRVLHLLYIMAKEQPYDWEPARWTLREELAQYFEAAVGRRYDRDELLQAAQSLLKRRLDALPREQLEPPYGKGWQYLVLPEHMQPKKLMERWRLYRENPRAYYYPDTQALGRGAEQIALFVEGR